VLTVWEMLKEDSEWPGSIMAPVMTKKQAFSCPFGRELPFWKPSSYWDETQLSRG
jgi:hypothetical protein